MEKVELSKFKRVKLASLPTELEEANRFSGSVRSDLNIYIKRDDNTGLALGGNKARKLEYLMADALEKGADVVLTTGGPQSNHARMTAAAAAKLGIKAVLVLRGKNSSPHQGNLLLDDLLGAELIFVDTDDYEDVYREMDRISDELAREGKTPYIIPVGGSTPLGALGYVNAFEEMIAQAEKEGIKVDYVVNAVGSGGTHAGLLVGSKLFHYDVEVIGISSREEREYFAKEISRIAGECSRLLGKDYEFPPEEIVVFDEYTGPGYGIPEERTLSAIKLLARTEGIILDPVYTGKAMAGLIDLARKNYFKPNSTVVFFHTGGAPANFEILVNRVKEEVSDWAKSKSTG